MENKRRPIAVNFNFYFSTDFSSISTQRRKKKEKKKRKKKKRRRRRRKEKKTGKTDSFHLPKKQKKKGKKKVRTFNALCLYSIHMFLFLGLGESKD